MRRTTAIGGELGARLAEARFAELYEENMRGLLGYAVRRCADPDDAADVVAETFLTAWRRLADVPPGPEARPWLFGTARKLVANQARSGRRRDRLTGQLREELRRQLPARPAPEEAPLREALAELPQPDRELLMLIGWEELTPKQAARALGISPAATRVRLHRARRRLRARMDDRSAAGPRRAEATENRIEEAS